MYKIRVQMYQYIMRNKIVVCTEMLIYVANTLSACRQNPKLKQRKLFKSFLGLTTSGQICQVYPSSEQWWP